MRRVGSGGARVPTGEAVERRCRQDPHHASSRGDQRDLDGGGGDLVVAVVPQSRTGQLSPVSGLRPGYCSR